MFFGYPIDVWVASLISAIFRLRYNKEKFFTFSSISTLVISGGSGVMLNGPLMTVLGLEPSWTLFMVILIALSVENLMHAVVKISSNIKLLENVMNILLNNKENK